MRRNINSSAKAHRSGLSYCPVAIKFRMCVTNPRRIPEASGSSRRKSVESDSAAVVGCSGLIMLARNRMAGGSSDGVEAGTKRKRQDCQRCGTSRIGAASLLSSTRERMAGRSRFRILSESTRPDDGWSPGRVRLFTRTHVTFYTRLSSSAPRRIEEILNRHTEHFAQTVAARALHGWCERNGSGTARPRFFGLVRPNGSSRFGRRLSDAIRLQFGQRFEGQTGEHRQRECAAPADFAVQRDVPAE